MSKNFKKFVAVLSAIAMVISSVTVYKNTVVEAVPAGYTAVTADGFNNYGYKVIENNLPDFGGYDFHGGGMFLKFAYRIGSTDDILIVNGVVDPEDGSANSIVEQNPDNMILMNVSKLPDNAYTTLEFRMTYDGEQKVLKMILAKGNPTGEEPTFGEVQTGGGGGNTGSTPRIISDENLVYNPNATVYVSSDAADRYVVGALYDRTLGEGSRWAANSNNGTNSIRGEWVYVDLGTTYKVSTVSTVWNYLPSSGYQIYYATEGNPPTAANTVRGNEVDTSIWTSATGAITNSVSDNTTENEIDVDVTARYIMWYMLSGTGNWGVSICEIGIYGTLAADIPAGTPNAPSKAILYNLTDAGQGFKAVIEDKKNSYEEEVTPSYNLYVNGNLVKTTTEKDVTLTEEELANAGLQNDSKTNSFYATVTVDGKTSSSSSTTYFYYKSGTVATSAYKNEVPRIYVSTSRTSSTQNIDLTGGTDKTKVDAGLVVESEGAVEASNYGTIKIRGNSTALLAKKPYNISFNSKVNLFHLSDRADGEGGKGEKKWSLLANLFDKTLLRNQISMDFQRGLEEDRNPAQAYTSKCMTVDLYVDGKYLGAYTLIESVDTGTDRVDIDDAYTKDTDDDEATTEGNEVAGTDLKVHDMLLELADDLKETGELSDRADSESYYFTTREGHYFAINNPARNEDLGLPYIPTADINQKPAWVQEGNAFVNAFETALATNNISEIKKYIDINSFVDFYITSEYFMTKDIGFSSTRFYIKDGKMYAGPLWDLDLSSGNILDGESAEGTYVQDNMSWFKSLMANETFEEKVKERYSSPKVQKTITALYAPGGTVDQAVAAIRKSVDANYKEAGWDLNTRYTTIWGQAYNSTVLHTNYDDYITDYKNWLQERNEWLLKEWPYEAPDYTVNDDQEEAPELFPNQKDSEIGESTTWYDYTNYSGVSSSTDGAEIAEHLPRFAYDDDATTRWGTAETDNHWLLIDLGTARTIRQIAISWETASAKDYTIEVSNDGDSFDSIATVTGRSNMGSGKNRLDVITFNEDQTYQYVRINCQTRATEYGFSIWELAIYGPDEQYNDEIDDSNVIIADEDDLAVEGFQIQANDAKLNGSVNYRTVCKSLKKGSTFSVGNSTYTVKEFGVIYARDWTNLTGDHAKDNLKAEHTLLNEGNPISGKQYSYVGRNTLGGNPVAVGYIASEAAVIDGWDNKDTEHSYYSVTMTELEGDYMAETNYVRAFIVATDGTIIYSKITALTSVAEIASHLYLGNKCKNVSAHQYLYDNILHSETLLGIWNTYGNIFYLDKPVEYGWDSSLYKPGNPYLDKDKTA